MIPEDLDKLRAKATAWLDDDPDAGDRAELASLVEALPASAVELADRFAGPLAFGTAGLRGKLRAGPNGMNLAVVRAAAAGLVAWLAARGEPGTLVIGYDARHRSHEFAMQTALVASGVGRHALLLPRPLPTPVLAYAVRKLGAVAGVMVTASHNPPQDNGYKVYLGAALGGPAGAGAQIAPPVDQEIEAAIRAVGPLAAVRLGEPPEVVPEELVKSYVDDVAATVRGAAGAGATGDMHDATAAGAHGARVADGSGPARLAIAYTPLHGVGAEIFTEVLPAAGYAAPAIVARQAEPDPDFPTAAFPNPEEPGTLDLLLELATGTGANLAIANDPDADRCAVAVPDGPAGWRVLRGDELGVLLADHLMRRGVRGLYATTMVSSSMLRAICAARGVRYAETFTGFKWIVRAGSDAGAGSGVAGDASPAGSAGVAGDELVFGYEEALGYCVAPQLVRDKDGISAALLACELASTLAAQGRTLSSRLDELAAEFGVYATDQVSVRVDDLAQIGATMSRLRARPPASLLGEPVTRIEDRLPEADVLTLRTPKARVVVRPSGTEPKLKAYLEVVEPVPDGDVPVARARAAGRLATLRADVAALVR
jgi:phosphomannomutase